VSPIPNYVKRGKLGLALWLLAAIIATAVPGWGISRASDLPKEFQTCNPDRAVDTDTTRAVRKGLWAGSMLFQLSCGSVEANLYFQTHNNQLRYEVVQSGSSLRIDAGVIPIATRSKLLEMLLQRLFAVESRRTQYAFATSAFPEINGRLAAASAASPGWNMKSGRPREHTAGRFVTNLANDEQLYPEIAKAFGAFGYRVRVDAAEDILVLPAQELSAADRRLISTPVSPADKLPASAAIFYNVQRSATKGG
jgi:hypothetical protein